MNSQNSKRLAKNTLVLYCRMFITMMVSLFTSRVILQTLGVDDYGVYNVVGGVVSMASLFTSSISTAISRFLTFALGKNDIDKLKTVFSTSVNIQVIMALFVVIIAEIVGLWFLNSEMNIPSDRLVAANWVFHFSVLSFAVSLISMPYNACVIAHERMTAMAYISIIEVILKLVIVYMLCVSPFDKLITYSFLLLCVAIFIRILYGVYCKRNFEECKYQLVLDIPLLKEMGAFAGWNLMGSGVYLFNTQGVNIISNLFFGVTVNAARGIAGQVEGVVKQFVTNFTTALNPQIIKSYASGDISYLHELVCRGAKFSYLLMFVLVLPFLFEIEMVLDLWLGEYPEWTPTFVRLTLIGAMVDMLGNSVAQATWATGEIKRYYLYVGSVGSLVFIVSYLLFYLGFPAYISYVVFIIDYILVLLTKLYIARDLIGLSLGLFSKSVLLRVSVTSMISTIIPMSLYFSLSDGLVEKSIIFIVAFVSSIVGSFMVGLTTSERKTIIETVIKRIFQR